MMNDSLYTDSVKRLDTKLGGYATANSRASSYYDQNYRVRLLDLGLPPEASYLRMTIGWARTVVDVLAERITCRGWEAEGVEHDVMTDLWQSSGANAAVQEAVVDSLVYGIGFISATRGDEAYGEPRVLVRAHSATSTTATISPRTGRVTEAWTRHDDENGTLWTDRAIVEMVKRGGKWITHAVYDHDFGRVPMIAYRNSARSGRRGGRSEITPAIRTAIDSATRAMVSMDVNREFFSIPHRYIVGVTGTFKNKTTGSPLEAWELAARSYLTIPADEETGVEPSVGEFSSVSAGPYLEQIRGLAQVVAAEAGIPSSFMGTEYANPSSADAIRMEEARLVRRSLHRIQALSGELDTLGKMALSMYLGKSVADTPRVSTSFDDPATSALSSDADAWTKLATAGVIGGDSTVILRKLGFTRSEIAEVQAERSTSDRRKRLEAIAQIVGGNAAQVPQHEPRSQSDGGEATP